MYQLHRVLQPETVEEAYAALTERKNNAVLGGCAFLKMGSKNIHTGVDLTKLNLADIAERNGAIEIGAMASLRDVETHQLLRENFCGMVPKALESIVGVQFRNTVSVGGSVYSRFGFSDFITALLALETDVELYNGGRMPLQAFLERPWETDILLKICIRKTAAKAAYACIRKSYSDFPVLNAAVSEADGQWRVVVGARPMVARLAQQASEILSASEPTAQAIADAAGAVSEELNYGTNMRASAGYRRAMGAVLVQRAVTEVLACR